MTTHKRFIHNTIFVIHTTNLVDGKHEQSYVSAVSINISIDDDNDGALFHDRMLF